MSEQLKRYRPIVTVRSCTKENIPLIVHISGQRYILDDAERRKERKAYERAAIEREILLDLLRRKGVELPRAKEMKFSTLRELILSEQGK